MTAQSYSQTTSGRAGGLLAALVNIVVIFTAGVIIGFVALTVLFRTGVAGSLDILFYRGLVLCGVAFFITVVLLGWFGHITRYTSWRDSISAGFLSMGVNLSFLVIVLVTLDRSNSVFILGYMAAQPERSFTSAQIDSAFRDGYLTGMRQIDRRMEEQRLSGNVVYANGGYTISPQGRNFVTLSRGIAELFDIDQRFLDPAGRRTISR